MEKQFTRGNLISILSTVLTGLVILTGVVTMYNKTDARGAHNASAISRLEVDMAQVQTSVQSLQVSNARTVAQFDALSRSLEEVKAVLSEINDMLRGERIRR